VAVPASGHPAGVLDYILSTDIENTLRKIQAAEAVTMPKMEIRDSGGSRSSRNPY